MGRKEVRARQRVRCVAIVAPSFDSWRSVGAAAPCRSFERTIPPSWVPADKSRLPGVLRKLQAIKYVRTIVTSLLYLASLVTRVYKYDVIHVFSASYFSFVLAPTPAILVELYGRRSCSTITAVKPRSSHAGDARRFPQFDWPIPDSSFEWFACLQIWAGSSHLYHYRARVSFSQRTPLRQIFHQPQSGKSLWCYRVLKACIVRGLSRQVLP